MSKRKLLYFKRMDGFAMPMVLFGMVIMSVLATVALSVSVDEQRASRAMRESLGAFYAAESGMQAIQVAWNDTTTVIDTLVDALAWGATLDLGWDTLGTGDRYHARITKLDTTGTGLYLLAVEGVDRAGQGNRVIHSVFNGGRTSLGLGGCCAAAALVRGGVDVNSQTAITGTDTDPPVWSGATCAEYPPNTQPGVIIDPDVGPDSLEISGGGLVSSGDSSTNNETRWATPAVNVDSTMDSSTFNIYGDKTLDDLKAAATIVLGDGTGNNIEYFWGGDPVPDSLYSDTDYFGPRIHTLGDPHGHVSGDPLLGTCDYDNIRNFGSPTGPCADHFPVIFIDGQVEMKDPGYEVDPNDTSLWEPFYMQGLVVMDTMPDGTGSEFELESPGTMAGIIVGKGCVELQDGSQTYGAVYLDGQYFDQDLCDGAQPLTMRKGNAATHPRSNLYYSECAVQRVLEATGLGSERASTQFGVFKLNSRYFTELSR